MSKPSIILNASGIQSALQRLAHEIVERNPIPGTFVLVGIQRGGVVVTQRLSEILEQICKAPVPTGFLDVSMHRDDLDHRIVPDVHPTSVPFDVAGRVVILVDDVLFSGRTVRAALDALNDFGRPRSVQLAVLVDRGHRELPIRADFVGKNIPTSLHETVQVRFKEIDGEDLVTVEKSEG